MSGEDSPQYFNLYGAVLRGITANSNNVDFVLLYQGSPRRLMLQLPCQLLETFEIVKKRAGTYFISKPPTPTGEVVCV